VGGRSNTLSPLAPNERPDGCGDYQPLKFHLVLALAVVIVDDRTLKEPRPNQNGIEAQGCEAITI